jgi:hypothetical protein
VRIQGHIGWAAGPRSSESRNTLSPIMGGSAQGDTRFYHGQAVAVISRRDPRQHRPTRHRCVDNLMMTLEAAEIDIYLNPDHLSLGTWRAVRQDQLVDGSGPIAQVLLEISVSQLLLFKQADPTNGAETLCIYYHHPLIGMGNLLCGLHCSDPPILK